MKSVLTRFFPHQSRYSRRAHSSGAGLSSSRAGLMSTALMGVAMLAMASASQVMAKMPEVLQAETGSDADTDFHDGPYVILNDARQKQAHWVCHRRLITTDVSIRLQRPKHCGALPQPTLFGPYAIDADHVSGVKTLVALDRKSVV